MNYCRSWTLGCRRVVLVYTIDLPAEKIHSLVFSWFTVMFPGDLTLIPLGRVER